MFSVAVCVLLSVSAESSHAGGPAHIRAGGHGPVRSEKKKHSFPTRASDAVGIIREKTNGPHNTPPLKEIKLKHETLF